MRSALAAALLSSVASATEMQYELFPYESTADPKAVVVHGKARFTVLTDSIIRMEYSDAGTFGDRPSLAFVNRRTPVPAFHQSVAGQTLHIATATVNLTYTPGAGNFTTAQTLRADPIGVSTFTPWTYGQTSATDSGNLRGTFRTLDGKGNESVSCTSGGKKYHCEWGLISRNGWALVDDTGVPVMDGDDWWTDNEGKMLKSPANTDVYLFAHSHRYRDALKEYTLVGGKIPIFPRNNHGVWFTRWYDFANADVMRVVDEYQRNGMPLDVMVLDMNWHKKDDWSGFSWDKNLYPYPTDLPDFIHKHGVTLAANLHDATGVGKWEDRYVEACKYMGLDPKHPGGPKGIPFTLINKTYVNMLEDVILKPIEQDGMDFWWIDWQQGESAGGTGQDGPRLKMNPTIWTDKMRVTDSIRRCKQTGYCTNKRGVVHARWGGLGNHRYQHGFSGDVAGLSWANLAYQTYFSATASNVGWGWWSHDIEGPGDNHEMYARWLQLGSFSGIMRSHDRGMSGGGCHGTFPTLTTDCSNVRPYNVPLMFRNANRAALVGRAQLLPYIYTQTKVGFEEGLGLTRPMYYYWPEEAHAYPVDMESNLGQEYSTRQYMFGDSILAAPVTKPSKCVSTNGPLEEPCGLTQQTVWVPPGTWVEKGSGKQFTGPKFITREFDLVDIPLYVRAGAILPSVPVVVGNSVGGASKQYTTLEFSVYPGAASGSYSVYEDDGHSYDYLKGKFGWVNAHYTRAASKVSVTVNTTGSFTGQLSSRSYTVKLVNTVPAATVSYTIAGKTTAVPFSRWGGAGTWSFDGQNVELVVELPALASASAVTVDVTLSAVDAAPLVGLKGLLTRATTAKRNLDETRTTPGAQRLDPQGAPLSNLASLAEALAFVAGRDVKTFAAKAANAWVLLATAVKELKAMATPAKTCQSSAFTDASDAVRTAKYPNGLTVADEGACCDACSGDAQCVAYVYETEGTKMCWPLAHTAGGLPATAGRSFGTPKTFTRNQYSLDLMETL